MQAIMLTILLAIASQAAGEDMRPLVGAIRWDAWTGGGVTQQVERTLGPRKYHDRLPWFTEVIDAETVKIDGGRPHVMEREIDFAAEAGLDYWAFLLYPQASSMSVGLQQYLASPGRGRINFCLILHNTLNVSAEVWPKELARAVALLREPGYQTVLDGRPLVYAFDGGAFAADRFGEFLAAAKEAGLRPYCVLMGWNPAADFKRFSGQGFEAVSAYAKPSDAPRYADLVQAVESDWRHAADSQTPYIPLVSTGWDKWPRKDHPVSWEKEQAYHRQTVFPGRATPAEIAAHLARALSFIGEHPGICRANSVIIYAWNEYDEGGWIAPTRHADGTADNSRLDAIGKVLKPSETRAKSALPAW